ncbi:MAG: PaaI family thioesterase [Candidatus Koribacter versatilis]|uniref:Medium/long-chain acyl-CoA thioesterase YigI n=1 Tax=Candidatus Korobacter versatilis TaxID=658062 RepID=A0A932EQE3_9BACT|nr:PaaI family thioesterase [Candidatus Koribacter versatilis]
MPAAPTVDFTALREFIARIPLFRTLHYRLDELKPGEATVTAPYTADHDGIFRSFHGGLLLTLADTAACCALLALTGPDQVMTTTDMNIRFLAPCNSDATARARVIKFGRTICPIHVDLFDAQGKHVALAQVTYMRLEKMPAR